MYPKDPSWTNFFYFIYDFRSVTPRENNSVELDFWQQTAYSISTFYLQYLWQKIFLPL